MPRSPMTRRRFLATAAAAPIALAPRPVRARSAVKIGTAVLGDYSMAGPVIVAREKGFFTEEDLAAEFVPFRGGPDLLKAVLAGDIHKISGPLLPVDGRIDVTALAVMQGTLLEYGVIKKKLPLEEHVTRAFTPVTL